MIGLATLGGGAVLGLTGGLAAPLLAAGAGSVIGAGSAAAAAMASGAGVAVIGSLFGAAGAGLAGYKMNKRVGEIDEFRFEPLTEGCQLNLTIAVTGWLTDENKGQSMVVVVVVVLVIVVVTDVIVVVVVVVVSDISQL